MILYCACYRTAVGALYRQRTFGRTDEDVAEGLMLYWSLPYLF
jgi:hypothetical protein